MEWITGATEYCEGFEVSIVNTRGEYSRGVPEKEWCGNGRLAIKAFNEAGYNHTEVDLIELLTWIKDNKPEILDEVMRSEP